MGSIPKKQQMQQGGAGLPAGYQWGNHLGSLWQYFVYAFLLIEQLCSINEFPSCDGCSRFGPCLAFKINGYVSGIFGSIHVCHVW